MKELLKLEKLTPADLMNRIKFNWQEQCQLRFKISAAEHALKELEKDNRALLREQYELLDVLAES